MKHIITGMLLALAIAAGLLLPEIYMEWQDRELETPKIVSVTEPTLEWNLSKAQSAEEEISSEEIARRLTLFQAGPQVAVPIGNYTKEDVQWATERAMAFLNMVLEMQPEVHGSGSEYQLAWFEDGTTIPFWTTYINFHGDCAFIVNIDAESGVILQCLINPNANDLSELFPESFEQGSTQPNTYFEELVAQRFCDALGFFMGRNDGGENPVIPSQRSAAATVKFSDNPDLQVEMFFIVDLFEGIRFNYPLHEGAG